MADLPRGTLKAAVEALQKHGVLSSTDAAMAVLEATYPMIVRHARREVAREVLALDEADRKFSGRGSQFNHGPYGDMQSSLRRLARGEALPDASELRGGTNA